MNAPFMDLTTNKKRHAESLLNSAAAIFAAEMDSMEAIQDLEELAPWFKAQIGFKEMEHFAAVFLDHGKRVVGRVVFPEGSKTRTVLFPRKLFKAGLEAEATMIVLAHNHPSGTTMPSPQDRELTRRVQQIGESLEVNLADHFIVTPKGEHISFKKHGWM